jgi:hypothetical protein
VHVLVFERNLLWSSRLKSGLVALGHRADVLVDIPTGDFSADLAIVNLSQPTPLPKELIGNLKRKGIKTVAHAGHKERDLMALGRDAGADVLATNGELAAKLAEVIHRAAG